MADERRVTFVTPRAGVPGPRRALDVDNLRTARAEAAAAALVDTVHLGRQPVFDVDQDVVGYELLFRRSGSVVADVRDPEQATADVVVKTFADFGLDSVVGSKLAFVNLPRGFLIGSSPLPFAPERVVLEVLEDVVADPEVLAGMRNLRDRGFRFALDDFTLSPETEPLIELCDYAKLDVLALTTEQLVDHVQRLRPSGIQLLAEKVETTEQLELCRSLSFSYFQGYLLSRPTVLSRRSLDSTRLACLRLLAVLAAEDYDVADAVAAIQSDPGLALRVLRTVNSAASGLRRRVSTVREAVVLLGPRALMGWVLLIGMSGRDRGTPVNVDVALTRARMCELLAPRAAVAPDVAFTVGLVASLELLLGLPLAEATADLPLDADVLEAALRHGGSLGSVLSEVLAYEAQSPLRLVSLPEARDAYLASLAWTRSILARASG
jgi:EAL and modified HD-GYP domain-containing signal transduction protein